MKPFLILFLLAVLHGLPLLSTDTQLAGGQGDPFAHAAIGGWYCPTFVSGDYQSDQFLAPYGANLAANYDSPFPFVLACVAWPMGSHAVFHLFAFLQILLVIGCAFLVARSLTEDSVLQMAYVLMVWFCGFYIARSTQHFTLLSQIWALQLVFYTFLNISFRKYYSVIGHSLLLALAFCGTFQNIPTLIPVVLLLATTRLLQQRPSWQAAYSIFGGLLVAGAVIWWFWGPMVTFTLENGAPFTGNSRSLYNLDLISPFLPFESHVFHEWLVLPKLDFERANQFSLLSIAIVIFGLVYRRFRLDITEILLIVIALLYFMLSWGPELRVAGQVVSDLPFNRLLFEYYPFAITRTPARLAGVADLIFVFLAFQMILKWSPKANWLKWVFLGWALVCGPILNQRIWVPTLNYEKVLPVLGLQEVAKLPHDKVVLNMPAAWAQDPSQNFLQLYHQHRITSGYLAYPAYTSEVMRKFLNTPILGNVGCGNSALTFQSARAVTDTVAINQILRQQSIGAIIINKSLLLSLPDCRPLLKWVRGLVGSPYMKTVEENNNFIVMVLQ